MEESKIVFLIMAGASVLFNMVSLIVKEEKAGHFSALMGWSCSVVWALI